MHLTHRTQLATLIPSGGHAVELGVAAGDFSVSLLEAGPQIGCLWSIDRWSDHHDAAEEAQARARLAVHGARSVVLRATFAEVVDTFADASLDLIYIDGYAHTGQEGGETLAQWWPKVRPGGIFAGHDYHPRWRPTMQAVDAFVATHGLPLNLCPADQFPSWWVRRPEAAK